MSEKKLIIDEDWKSQVQAEKEAARQSGGPEASAPGVSAGPAPATGQAPGESQAGGVHEPGDVPMPPASLELLVTTLATEALVALGQVPHPITGKAHVLRHQAQYLIDMIDVLREKTAGNVTPDEQRMIESVLHQLRMVFLETVGRPSS